MLLNFLILITKYKDAINPLTNINEIGLGKLYGSDPVKSIKIV